MKKTKQKKLLGIDWLIWHILKHIKRYLIKWWSIYVPFYIAPVKVRIHRSQAEESGAPYKVGFGLVCLFFTYPIKSFQTQICNKQILQIWFFEQSVCLCGSQRVTSPFSSSFLKWAPFLFKWPPHMAWPFTTIPIRDLRPSAGSRSEQWCIVVAMTVRTRTMIMTMMMMPTKVDNEKEDDDNDNDDDANEGW